MDIEIIFEKLFHLTKYHSRTLGCGEKNTEKIKL